MRETEVLVVGAGPTGLTLATLLRRGGVACIVVDKARGPSTTSKAIGLQYRVSEILAWMGLVDRFAERAAEQSVVNLRLDGRVAAQLILAPLPAPSPGGFAPRPLIVPQCDTEAILGDALRAEGITVEWGTELVDLAQRDDRVEAVLAGGERISARYLVSCEGAHSVARKREGIAFEGTTYPHDFIMADVAMDTSLRGGEAHSFLHPRGVLSAITMPGERRWRLFIEAGATQVGEVTLDAIRALWVERTGDDNSVISDPTWLTRFKIHARLVERMRSGRVFLAGDAAHLHSPSGGQGITTGMQDATNLAWKLTQVLRYGAPAQLLDTYDEERRPAARAVLAATDKNTKLLFAEGALAKAFRDFVFIPLLGTRFVQRRLVDRLSQLYVGYRSSSLSSASRRPLLRGIRSGDRVPDAALADGSTVFELLRSQRVIALFGAQRDEVAVALERLGIRTGVLAADALPGFGDRDEVWIVRPDGYLLCRCRATRLDHVQRALEQVFDATAVAEALDRGRVMGQTQRASA